MGSTVTPERLAVQFRQFGGSLPKITRDATGKAALMVKTVALAEMRTVIPSGRLRNMGRRKGGVKLAVKYTVTGTANPTALVAAVPPGPWAIVERGARAGYPIPRQTRTRGKQRVLAFGNGEFARGPVFHKKRIAGKYPWARARMKWQPLVKHVYGSEVRLGMLSTFR